MYQNPCTKTSPFNRRATRELPQHMFRQETISTKVVYINHHRHLHLFLCFLSEDSHFRGPKKMYISQFKLRWDICLFKLLREGETEARATGSTRTSEAEPIYRYSSCVLTEVWGPHAIQQSLEKI